MKREDFHSQYAKNLKGEYKVAYKKVDGMLSFMSSELNPYGSNMSEVVDLLLAAQEAGKPVGSVLGDDIYGFCCGIVQGTKFSVKEWLIQYFIRMRYLVLAFLFLSVMDVLFPAEGEYVSVVVLYTSMILLFLPFEGILSYLSYRGGKYVGSKGSIFFYGKLGMELVFLYVLLTYIPNNTVFLQVSALVPEQLDIGIMFLVFCFASRVQKKRKKVTSEEENIKFSELVYDEEFNEMLMEKIQKMHAKYLRKCNKKGKVALDIVAWDEKKLKEFEFINKWCFSLYPGFIAILALVLLVSYCMMGFDTALDFLIYAGIQGMMLGGVVYFGKKINAKSYACRRDVHEKIIEASIEE